MNLTKSITISLACVAIAGSAMAQTFKEWHDPNINEVNRMAMHADCRATIFRSTAFGTSTGCVMPTNAPPTSSRPLSTQPTQAGTKCLYLATGR